MSEINRQIAELLGFTDIREHWFDPPGESNKRLVGLRNGTREYLPDYEHSLDAVVAALTADCDLYLMHHDKGYWIAKMTPTRPFDFNTGSGGHFFGQGETRQQAVALVLYAWLTLRKEQEATPAD